MKKDLFFALIAYFFLLIASFIVSITLGFGRAESSRELSSLLWYGRRGAMVVAAIAIPWFTKKQTLSALGWQFPGRWLLFSCGIGLCLGFFNKGGFIQGGEAPGDEYLPLMDRIMKLSPYNPASVANLEISFN